MAQMTFGEAKIAAVAQAMRQDERVVIIGGASFGGHRYPAMGVPLREEFPSRVYATPIAELGYVGVAVGAAMTGLRPIVTVATSSFIYEAWPQIINEAPNIHYMTAGQTNVPLMVHVLTGIRIAGAAQHSARPQAMFMQTPGLQIITPATAEDALAMLQPALDSERPTIWADHAPAHGGRHQGRRPRPTATRGLRQGGHQAARTGRHPGGLRNHHSPRPQRGGAGIPGGYRRGGRGPAHALPAGPRLCPGIGGPHPPSRHCRRVLVDLRRLRRDRRLRGGGQASTSPSR